MEKVQIELSPSAGKSFFDVEGNCEALFSRSGPFWHLFTPGELSEIIFTNQEEFKVGMNFIGICADKYPQVNIMTFALMNNHIHIVLSGVEMLCQEMFDMFATRLKIFFTRSKRWVDLSRFKATLLPITDLKQLRNTIVYVHRNGYLTNTAYMPSSYPWGSGYLFFNQMFASLPAVPYNSLTFRSKRHICKCSDIVLSDRIMVYDDVIMPSSFCHVSDAEVYFRNSHQYFKMLSKDYEAFSDIARQICDTMVLSDEEMYSAVCVICLKQFKVKRPALLPPNYRIDVAKIMHYEFMATNKQIVRILKIDKTIVSELFPKP